jgi:branched-chain amino acid aminotransferase
MLELLTDTRVDLARSGARHGVGLFETIRVRRGAPLRLEAHLQRLAAGARFLGLEPPPEPPEVLAFLAARTGCRGLASGALRLLAVDRSLLVTVAPWAPDLPDRIELGVSRHIRRISGSPLHGFKTLSCLENRLLDREAAGRGLFEVLALNEDGRITDGGRTNVFLALGGRLLTPAAADGALPGVARRTLLEAGLAQEAALTPDDLAGAEAVLLTNALRGGVPVHALAGIERGPLDAGHVLLARAMERLAVDG